MLVALALASDGAVLQKEIDKDLKINKKVTSTEVKVLLLGKDARSPIAVRSCLTRRALVQELALLARVPLRGR